MASLTLRSRPQRILATLCQLSMIGLQVVFPLLVRLTAGRSDAFVRGWASEALNLQLIWIGPFLLLALATVRSQSMGLFYLTVGLFAFVGIYAVTCGVVGARKAWRGETWEYPLNIRLVR